VAVRYSETHTAGGNATQRIRYRYLILLIVILILSGIQHLQAQRKADIGFFAGTSYYMGDINTNRQFYQPALAIGPLYRYNFNPRSSLRFTGIYHQLKGNDLDFTDPYKVARGASFSGSYIDLALMYEFNFLPYTTANRKLNYSLYIAGGPGYHIVMSSQNSTGISPDNHFTIPFSLGFKFNAGKRLSAGIEWSPRKTYTDRIDGVENLTVDQQDHLVGNNDWYTFAGIFITYKIFKYREDCPTYD